MPIDFRASQIQTNKIIASGSTGTETGAQIVVYSHLADDGTAPNQGFINQSTFVTSSIGTDIFLYVSGGIGERNISNAQSITCFGGDVHISGNLTVDGSSPGGGGGSNFFWSPSNPNIEASGSLAITGSGYFKAGLSGSLQQVSSGVPYLLAGPNITITTNSLGQIAVSSSGGGGGSSFYRLEVLDYYSTNATSDTAAGQVIFPANQFTGSIVLYGVIANSDSTATGSVRLYNVTSGAYVELGGPGNEYLSVSGTTPTIVSSVNLISASNFNSSSQAIYELQVSSSNGASYGFFGGFELRPSGSFTGVTYMTSSTYYTYVSGTWEDGGNKLATTSSVAMAGNLGTGYFADAIGTDSFFFVSGVQGGKDGSVPGVAVFGGDVVISGTLHGGSPLKVGSPTQFFDDVTAYFKFQQGNDVSATGDYSHAQGQYSAASGFGSHAEGGTTTASGLFAHSEGSQNTASGEASHAEGVSTTSSATGSHAEGQTTVASGDYSHAEGTTNTASGYAAHAEGGGTTAVGSVSHAEGADTVSFGNKSHAEGDHTLSYGPGSHAEGYYATGSGDYSHAEGSYTTAGGNYSHAEGIFTFALGEGSHSEGIGTIASGSNQHVLGKYNKRDNNFSLFVIGDGTGDDDSNRGDIVRVNSGSSIGTGRVEVTGSIVATLGLSGSLTKLSDGTSYLIAGSGTNIVTGSNGSVTISATVQAAPTLQQTYDAGIATIAVNNLTGSFVLSGGLSPIGFNYPPLLRLEPGNGGPFASNFNAIDILGYAGSPPFVPYTSASLINIRTANSLLGGAEIMLRSTTGTPSKISWFSGAGELYGSTATAFIYYHPSDSSLYFDVTGPGQKNVMKDSGGQSGTANIAEFINATTTGGGTVKFFTGANTSNATVLNSGSFEQSGSSVFKNKVEVTGSLSVSGSGGSNGTLTQYNGLRYYPTIVTSLPYTASLNDYIIAVSASAGPGVELPASEFGRTFIVKDVSGSAASDLITITAAGGELIDGSPTATIGIDNGSYKFVYFGSGIGWGIV